MKRNKLISFILTLIFVFGNITVTNAQVSVSNVLERAQKVIEKLESDGHQVLYMKIDNVKKDDISLNFYSLTAGSDYAIIATGDADRLLEIDLAVLDENNQLAGKDTDNKNLAIVKITPKKSQTYKFSVKGYRMSKSDGFYALIVCRLSNSDPTDKTPKTTPTPTPKPAPQNLPTINLGKYVSKVTSLKKVALHFLKNNDPLKARTALELAKEEEYLEYLGRSNRYKSQQTAFNENTDSFRFQNVKYQNCEEDYVVVKNQLTDLAVEANLLKRKKLRSPEEETKLYEIKTKLDCLGEEYNKRLNEIFGKTVGFEKEIEKYHQIPKLRAFMSLLDKFSTTDEQTVIIYTLSMKDEYWMILVTPDIIDTKSVSVKSADISQKIIRFRNAIQNRYFDPKSLAQELYKDILEPFAETLDKIKAKTIVWSLDRELRYLPVAALHDGKQYLVEKYSQVIYTPAAVSRLNEEVPRNLDSVGFGVSNSKPPLPGVKTELEGLFNNGQNGILKGNFFINEQFTMQKLREQRNVLSLHIASHFFLKPGQNTKNESFLLLGNNEKLFTEKIANSVNFFEGVHLLTLSACDTAYSAVDSNGNEFESFAVSAQDQGAQSVMATLWQVNDLSTSEFMKTFYMKWLSYPIQTKAKALQQTQLSIMNGKYKNVESERNRGVELASKTTSTNNLPPYKKDPNAPFEHPYYWSPYVLIGNWK